MAQPSVIASTRGEQSGRRRLSRSGELADRRILVVAPQPFYQDRGTPIALRQVLHAASELGYRVDLLTFPIGADVQLPGAPDLSGRQPTGLPFDAHRPLVPQAGPGRFAPDRRACPTRARGRIPAFTRWRRRPGPRLVLARRHGVPLLYDMQSSIPEQLLKHALAHVPPIPTLLAGRRAVAAHAGGSGGRERGAGRAGPAHGSRREGPGMALPQHAERGAFRPRRSRCAAGWGSRPTPRSSSTAAPSRPTRAWAS